MPLTIPPELKKITPYVRRAEELDKDKSNAESRLVAYYCRQYAVHTGIGLATSPTGKTCLGELLSALEEEKTAMDSFTRDEAKFLCSKFADKIFEKADSEDRSGAATKATAKTFYAAASFLEILNQFYKDDEGAEEVEDFKKRAVYAKWKATDILKAIKEGRDPTPGGYGEEANTVDEEALAPTVETVAEDEDGTSEPEAPIVRLPSTEQEKSDEPELAPDTAPVPPPKEEEPAPPKDEGTEVSLGPPPTYDFEPLPPPPSQPTAPAKPPLTFSPAPAPPPMPAPPVVKPTPPPAAAPAKKSGGGIFGFGKKKSKTSKAELADAMELTKFALAALEEKNADLAAERLTQALGVLGR